MDLLKYRHNIKTNKLINGETVSYTTAALFSVFLLIAIKQLLKVFIGINPQISCIIAFVIAEIISFLLEKRFVFRKNILSSDLKQVLLFVFKAAVDLGFYKLADFTFGDLLKMDDAFVWLIAVSTAFFFNYFFDRTLLFDCDYDARSIRYSKIYLLFYNNRFVFAAAGLAALCIAVIYIAYSVFPFGDYTVMRMDLYHQYGPLFAELYDRVVNHQSFFYSWNSGGGSSFLGNYFNYLSSPLSAIIFLFDKENISQAISSLVSLKCILSAVTFCYYIKSSQKQHSFLSAVFGVQYAFSAYFLAYYWNVMWLDGMILLPLIALGIEKIINKGKSTLYITSMVLLFLSSYYMGFMSCIFAVIYFLGYFVISLNGDSKINPNKEFDKKYSFKALMNNKFFNRGFRFAVSSAVAAGICAFTLIPIFCILKSSSATSDTFPSTFESYFNVFDFLTSHLAGLETTIRSSGDDVLPNVYSGIAVLLLIPLFIVNKNIRFKEKAVYVLMLLFFLFSFNNNCMNYIWHALHFPNDLPFRFSYMYSFLILAAAFKCFSKIKGIDVKDICFVGMAWVFFICLAQKMATTKMAETTIYISIAFVIIWTGFLYLVRKGKMNKAFVSALAVLIVFCEVIISDTGAILITQKNSDYKTNYKSYAQAIETIRESDSDFYREELTYLETRMDPCYYGYNGMSTFSSMAYEDYSQLQYSLGMFGNRINSYTYNTQTPVYNMMFSIKYLIKSDVSLEPDENLYDFMFATTDGNTNVYKNKYFLPIALCAKNDLENWVVEEGDPFKAQSDFFECATGYSDVFKEVTYLSTDYDSISGEELSSNGTYWFSKLDSEINYGYVNIKMTPEKSGNLYLYVSSPDIETIEINSSSISSHTQSISEPYIIDLGYYDPGEEVTVSLDCQNIESTDTYADIYAYTLDNDVFEIGYKLLRESAMNITDYSDTKIEGTINVNENSYLYTSIPYDKGWSILIDGEESETFEIGGCLLGTAVKPGEHTIVLKYSPRGLSYGIIISAATIAGICGYIILFNKIKKRKTQGINPAEISLSE